MAGYLAALMYLCYVLELYAATNLYPQTIAGLLVTIAVAQVVRADKLTLWHQLRLLAVATFQVLLIPNCVIVAAAVYSYAIVKRKLTLQAGLAAGSVMLLIIMAWCYRNELAFGEFTFGTTMGSMLRAGNRDNITAAGAAFDNMAEANAEFAKPEQQLKARDDLSEGDADRLNRKLAIDWIWEHRWLALRLFLEKFTYWFSYENQYYRPIDVPLMGVVSLGIAVNYYAVLIGALVAIGSRQKNLRHFAVLVWIIYLAAALTYAIFLTRIRYRLPFDPLLFILGSGAVLKMAQRAWPFWRVSAWQSRLSDPKFRRSSSAGTMVKAPTPEEEDRRRVSREGKVLIAERVQHVNRIKGLRCHRCRPSRRRVVTWIIARGGPTAAAVKADCRGTWQPGPPTPSPSSRASRSLSRPSATCGRASLHWCAPFATTAASRSTIIPPSALCAVLYYVPATNLQIRFIPAEAELSPNFGDGVKDQAAAWA
jgi:hypothetical protein